MSKSKLYYDVLKISKIFIIIVLIVAVLFTTSNYSNSTYAQESKLNSIDSFVASNAANNLPTTSKQSIDIGANSKDSKEINNSNNLDTSSKNKKSKSKTINNNSKTIKEITLVERLELPPQLPEGECLDLNQSFFSDLSGDVTFDYNVGCIKLTQDISFNNTIILEGGLENNENSFYFDCDGHKVIGQSNNRTDRFLLNDFTEVRNCTAQLSKNGFILKDNSIVRNSISENTADNSETNYAFVLENNSQLFDSNAICTQTNRTRGVKLSGNSKAYNVYVTQTKQYGFELHDFAEVHDSIVTNHFYMNQYNNGIQTTFYSAYYLDGNSEVYNSISKDGTNIGFYLAGDSYAKDCLVTNNEEDGFYLKGHSRVEDSNAVYNQLVNTTYGFKLLDYSRAININSNNNRRGIYISENALLENGNRFCNNVYYILNQGYGMDVNNNGTMIGTFYADNYFGIGDISQATIYPCVFSKLDLILPENNSIIYTIDSNTSTDVLFDWNYSVIGSDSYDIPDFNIFINGEFNQTITNDSTETTVNLPIGDYNYQIKTLDYNGNLLESENTNFHIRNNQPILFLEYPIVSVNNISQENNAITISFNGITDNPDSPTYDYNINFYDVNKNLVSSDFNSSNAEVTYIWNGIGNDGNYVSDGFYNLIVYLAYDDYNISSEIIPIIIDRTSPLINLDYNVSENLIYLLLNIFDSTSGIENYSISVYKGQTLIQDNNYSLDNVNNYFTQYRFTGDYDTNYRFVITARDLVNNQTTITEYIASGSKIIPLRRHTGGPSNYNQPPAADLNNTNSSDLNVSAEIVGQEENNQAENPINIAANNNANANNSNSNNLENTENNNTLNQENNTATATLPPSRATGFFTFANGNVGRVVVYILLTVCIVLLVNTIFRKINAGKRKVKLHN
ncbi:MAG: hypothetical protein V1824_04205 [archaeon]